jgi:hypothetical protein
MASILSSVALLDGVRRYRAMLRQPRNVHVKDLVPVRIQCLLDDRGRACLFAADCRNCEGIRES